MTLKTLRIVAAVLTAIAFVSLFRSIMLDGAGTSPAELLWRLLLLLFTYFLFRISPHRRQLTTHGSAGWARSSDLKGLLVPASAPTPPGGLFVAPYGRRRKLALPPELAQRHVLLVGGTGTGKTRCFFMPNTAYATGSYVATDPKGELWQHTSGYHQQAWRFAPREPDASAGFNWIPLCRDEYMAQLLAAAVLQLDENTREEPFWKQSELQLCAALFAHAALQPVPTPASAFQLLRLGPAGVLAPLFDSPSPLARACATFLADLKPETRAGIVLGVANRLTFLQDPAIRRFTSAQLRPPDFSVLMDQPIAVCWVVHEHDAALLAPLSSLFFTVLLDQLVRREPGTVPVTLFLDEFANIGRLPHFPTTISVARGRGLSLVLGVQSLSQLEGLYGRAGAATIRTNCATKLILHGLEFESAEQVSRALGDTTVWDELASRRPAEGLPFTTVTSHSEQHFQRRLLTADEVRRIGDHEMLILVSNLRPIRARREFWDRAPVTAFAPPLGPERLASPVPQPLRQRLRELDDGE